jgi:hypothetical protein
MRLARQFSRNFDENGILLDALTPEGILIPIELPEVSLPAREG